MGHCIRLTRAQYQAIRRHLLQNSLEYVAFAFCRAVDASGNYGFVAQDVYLVPPDEYAVHGEYRVELTDDAQARLIKAAWDRRAALVEFHSHPTSRGAVAFSPSDLYGFDEFVPHVRWRLKGTSYAAVVLGQRSFDAVAWVGPSTQFAPVEAIVVDGHTMRPSGHTVKSAGEQLGKR